MKRLAAVLLVVAFAMVDVRATVTSEAEVRPEIAAIRADLEAARFEKVISAATSLLALPDLPASEVVQALTLRSQARVGQGDLKKAEEDWRRLLTLQPGYAPDPVTTGRKAIERFDRLQHTIVGTVRFAVEPSNATIELGGIALQLPPDGVVALVAGSHRVSVSSPGFDAAQLDVNVVAGTVTPVEVRLVPNARRVVVTTEDEGVEVWLAGRLLGRTQKMRENESPLGGPASLSLDALPLGDYVIELRKECYRPARFDVNVSIDVLDRSAIAVTAAPLAPARSLVTFSGGVPGTEISWGGESVAKLPLESPVSLCAGTRVLEARVAGRAMWRGTVDVPEEGDIVLDVSPRPNAAILGSSDWPDDLSAVSSWFGVNASVPIPADADLATSAGWRTVKLPPDTDLAIAVVPPIAGVAGHSRVYIFSPWLGTVDAVENAPAPPVRTPWRTTSLGWRLSDSTLTGGAVVVNTTTDGPAAASGIVPGERLIAVRGKAVRSASEARAVLAAIAAGTAIEVTIAPIGAGEPRLVRITPNESPAVPPAGSFGPVERAIVAAFAAVDGAGSLDAPAANATLGGMLTAVGRPEQAIDVLRRARFGTRPGIGDGSVAYLMGVAFASAGRDAEAREAFRKAAASSATAFADDGPEVAPAATDHLADLGATAR